MSDAASDFTPNLTLPFLLPAQAQKHVTVNESLAAIDALLMGAVVRADLNDPPVTPESGSAFIVSELPTGAWENKSGSLAVWTDDAWTFYSPREGWRIWDQQSEQLLVFQSSTWQVFAGAGGDIEVDSVGVGTVADASNPLSVRGPGALFTALATEDGGSGDFRLAINADAGAHTASIIYQSGWSGRAETGLTTSGDYAVRVSADGSAWSDAIRIDPATAHIGVNMAPDVDDVLTVDGPVKFATGDDYIRVDTNGRLIFWNHQNDPVYMLARSPGSNLHLGVTKTDGTLKSSALMIRGDSEEIHIDFPLRPRTTDAIDLGAPWRVFQNLYVQNAPVISSDQRGKYNIEPFDAGLELLQSLNPVSFRRARDPGRRHIGLIAQHVREALEEQALGDTAIWQLADPNDPKSSQAISYGELIPVLIDAVNELAERVEDLEAARR